MCRYIQKQVYFYIDTLRSKYIFLSLCMFKIHLKEKYMWKKLRWAKIVKTLVEMFPFHSYMLIWIHDSRFYSFRFKLGNWLAILINYYYLAHNHSWSYNAFEAFPLTLIISKLISSRVNGFQQNQRHQELTNKGRWARKICLVDSS